MKQLSLILATLLLLSGQTACCTITLPEMPEVNIEIPTLEVGEMRDKRETIPLSGADATTVEIRFGAGELEVEAGAPPDKLFTGRFRYNVEQWEPRVSYEDNTLIIEQGGFERDRERWGIPTGNTHNEWELKFSPQVPIEMNFKIGAGEGDLDFTGLTLSALDLDAGAGNFDVHFGQPNEIQMSTLSLDAGASKLSVMGIGNANPEEVTVQGGMGDISLDFTGKWARSADVRINAGVGSITLRLPDNVGVQVEAEGGLTNVEVDGLQRKGDAYVNDVFNEAEIELHIQVTTGVGSLRLIEVPND